MVRALKEFTIEGVATTIPAHLVLLETTEFVAGTHTTRTVEEADHLDALVASPGATGDEDVLMVEGRPVRLWNPAMSASAPAAVHGAASGGDLVAPMQGTILKVLVGKGQQVEAGEALVVLEAMKMETVISAQRSRHGRGSAGRTRRHGRSRSGPRSRRVTRRNDGRRRSSCSSRRAGSLHSRAATSSFKRRI